MAEFGPMFGPQEQGAQAEFGNGMMNWWNDIVEDVGDVAAPYLPAANALGHAQNVITGIGTVISGIGAAWTASDYARYKVQQAMNPVDYPGDRIGAQANIWGPGRYSGPPAGYAGPDRIPNGYPAVSRLPDWNVDTVRSRHLDDAKARSMIGYLNGMSLNKLRGPLNYVDAYLDDVHLTGTTALAQLHMTDDIVGGTGLFGRRTGRQIWSQLLCMHGQIYRDRLWSNPDSEDFTTSIVEYGVLYDRSGNASSYTADDLFLSNDNTFGHRINAPENLMNEDRFIWLLRKRQLMNWSEQIDFASCENTTLLMEDVVDIPDLVTTYPDETSPPNTGEIFIYFRCEHGTALTSPYYVRLTARLRYFDNGPPLNDPLEKDANLWNSEEESEEEICIENIPYL